MYKNFDFVRVSRCVNKIVQQKSHQQSSFRLRKEVISVVAFFRIWIGIRIDTDPYESFLFNLWLEITYLPFVVYYVHTKFHKQKFHQDTSLFVWLFDQLDLLFFNFFPALVTPMTWADKQFCTQRSFFGLGGATAPRTVAQKRSFGCFGCWLCQNNDFLTNNFARKGPFSA